MNLFFTSIFLFCFINLAISQTQFNITNCRELNGNLATTLSIFRLMNDINCTGWNFNPIDFGGSNFGGILSSPKKKNNLKFII